MPAIDKLIIKGFKAFPQEFVLNFEGKHLLLYGENGSGKSSIYYALHCLLHSALKGGEGKKYFNLKDEFGNDNSQNLVNIHHKDDNPHIYLLQKGTPFVEMIDKDGYHLAQEAPSGNHTIPDFYLKSVFVNHKFLFHFFSFRNSEQVNLFTVFEKDILPFILDEKMEYFLGFMLAEIKRSVPMKGNRVDKSYYGNIEYFNQQLLKTVIEVINNNVNDLYKEYFYDQADKELTIKLHYLPNDKKPDEDLEYWLKYDYKIDYITENGVVKERKTPYRTLNTPFIRLEINEKQTDGEWRNIPKPQAYFNEAKLTAIALSIRFALVDLIAPPEGSFLALDDMLISLDMSNRTKVIDFLLSISNKYKIYLFTHDRAFFELAKEKIKRYFSVDTKKNWLFKELYNNEDTASNPKLLDSETFYAKAKKHYDEFDYPAAANYLRKSVEELLENDIFPKYISKKDNGETLDKLRAKLDAAIKLIERLDGRTINLLVLVSSVNLLLNPLSHRSIDTNVYRSELKKVFDVLPLIKEDIGKLTIKEILAQKAKIYCKIDENSNTSCEIEIELIEALYSFVDSSGNRQPAKTTGQSLYSVTTTNGVKGNQVKHEYNKGDLEDICKQIHTYIKAPYNGDFMDLYTDDRGKKLAELITQ